MRFEGLSNKFVCYVILIFPFLILLLQIVGLYAIQPSGGVTQELGFIAINSFFIIFVSTLLFFLKPSVFWNAQISAKNFSYQNTWIVLLLTSIAVFASLYNAYEIHSQFGLPLILIGNGEEMRLSQPLNKYINFFQSFWFIALPLLFLVRKKLLTFLLIFSVVIYSAYIGSRGAILFLVFVFGISMRFTISRATLLIAFAGFLILVKAFQINISVMDYFIDLSTSQADVLNLYISKDPNLYWGWFTYVRLFGPLIPGDHLSLIDLQNILLGIQFDGLYVATAYVYPYLDFGLYGVIFFQYFNFLLAILVLKKFSNYPITCTLVLFGLTISFYDALFNQLFYLILITISIICDLLMRKDLNYE